jgi:dTDP-4-dehydrorhamnose reductase
MKFLVAGGGGMLGTAFVSAARESGHQVTTLGRADLNVDRFRSIGETVREHSPHILINCAAHTDVDGAESDVAGSFAANAVLPEILAAISRRLDIRFVHFSSTGCYGIARTTPYDDFQPLDPTTVHHRSKAMGEVAVRATCAEALIVRTGWLYGGSRNHPKNFVWKRILEARDKEMIVSDDSQVGNPTYVVDVAMQVLFMIEACLGGTFNCVAGGTATRRQYVEQIVRAAGLSCRVEAAPPGYFARRALVSPNEGAINLKLSLLGIDRMPKWRTSVEKFVQLLMEVNSSVSDN